MKIHQLDIKQIESAYNTDIENGLINVNNDEVYAKGNKFTDLIVGTYKESVKKFSHIHIIAAVSLALAMIFGILNQTWLVFWSALISMIIYFLLFFAECGGLYFLKKKYFKHIENFDKKVTVLKNGIETIIPLSDLHIGDVICLKEGTILQGDARIVSSNRLFADESVVFEKTIPVAKTDVAIAEENILPEDQKNMLWKGSFISSGSGIAVVVALDEDCYIYKTGGRQKRNQRSYVYNRRNNVGKIISFVFLFLCVILFLLSAIISGRWTECLAVFGIFTVFLSLEPISCITEWNYYRYAQKLYLQGGLVRNIAVFDEIEKENDIYFEADMLLSGQQKFRQTIVINGEERVALSYFSLLNNSLVLPLDKYDLSVDKLERLLPVYRKETDEYGNRFCLFTDEGESILALCGYWRRISSYIDSVQDEFYKMAEELEIHGKMVYLLATSKKALTPGSLVSMAKTKKLQPMSFVIFDIEKNDQTYQMINRLKRSGLQTHLINPYADQLGDNLRMVYDLNGVMTSAPDKKSCSIPKSDSNVVFDDASMIEKEKADLILAEGIMPQKIVYAVKCMFCGINRSLNFIGMIALWSLIGVFILILRDAPIHSILFPLLALQPALIVSCYYLTETVRNCNQSKYSLWMGLLFGVPILAAALVGCDMTLMVPGLSVILYGLTLLVRSLRYRPIKIMDGAVIFASLFFVAFPWFFIGGNWLVALLFAIFPAAAAHILDFIY